MENLTKAEKAGIEDGTIAITGSSKMHQFCIDTAHRIANFYREEAYPLSEAELKPFLTQIKKEFKKIFKATEARKNKVV